MKKFLKLAAASAILPLISHAQLTGTETLIVRIGNLVRQLIVVVAGFALLAFFWGLAKFILKAGDDKSHEEGRNLMKWGLIALFVMVSVWGIIRFFQGELGIGGAGSLGPVIFGQ